MRDDFQHVIVERPRQRSWGNPYREMHPASEEAPTKEAIRPRGKGFERRHLGVNLRPLVRFLEQNVGRPWDKVYSEFRAANPNDSKISTRIYRCLSNFLNLKYPITLDEKGRPLVTWFGRTELLTALSDRWPAFYVHPKSGILCKAPVETRERVKYTPPVPVPPPEPEPDWGEVLKASKKKYRFRKELKNDVK